MVLPELTARSPGKRYAHEDLSHMSDMTSGAPFTYISMLVLFSRLTITLIRRREETKSNVRITPNSKKCACYLEVR